MDINVQLWWNTTDRGQLKHSREKPIPVPLHPPHFPQTSPGIHEEKHTTKCLCMVHKERSLMPSEQSGNVFHCSLLLTVQNTLPVCRGYVLEHPHEQ